MWWEGPSVNGDFKTCEAHDVLCSYLFFWGRNSIRVLRATNDSVGARSASTMTTCECRWVLVPVLPDVECIVCVWERVVAFTIYAWLALCSFNNEWVTTSWSLHLFHSLAFILTPFVGWITVRMTDRGHVSCVAWAGSRGWPWPAAHADSLREGLSARGLFEYLSWARGNQMTAISARPKPCDTSRRIRTLMN